jgi:hypothetical protein
MKLLGRRSHGFVDYGTAATQIALAALLPARPRTRILVGASGLAAAALGALTNYELGLFRVLPMRGHLAVDGFFAVGFLGAAAALDERTPVRGLLAGFGALAAGAAAFTDPDRR